MLTNKDDTFLPMLIDSEDHSPQIEHVRKMRRTGSDPVLHKPAFPYLAQAFFPHLRPPLQVTPPRCHACHILLPDGANWYYALDKAFCSKACRRPHLEALARG